MSSKEEQREIDLPARTLQDGRGAGSCPLTRSHAGRGTAFRDESGCRPGESLACGLLARAGRLEQGAYPLERLQRPVERGG